MSDEKGEREEPPLPPDCCKFRTAAAAGCSSTGSSPKRRIVKVYVNHGPAKPTMLRIDARSRKNRDVAWSGIDEEAISTLNTSLVSFFSCATAFAPPAAARRRSGAALARAV